MNAQRLKLLAPLTGAVLAIALFGVVPPTQAAVKQPNIVFILMDNLGYSELGDYGGGISNRAGSSRSRRTSR